MSDTLSSYSGRRNLKLRNQSRIASRGLTTFTPIFVHGAEISCCIRPFVGGHFHIERLAADKVHHCVCLRWRVLDLRNFRRDRNWNCATTKTKQTTATNWPTAITEFARKQTYLYETRELTKALEHRHFTIANNIFQLNHQIHSPTQLWDELYIII